MVNRVLSDEQTILEAGRWMVWKWNAEAKRVLRDALEDQELRNSAKDSIFWRLQVLQKGGDKML